MSEAIETLDQIVSRPKDRSEGDRDAIHIAVIKAQAAHMLRPGDHVGQLLPGGEYGIGRYVIPVGIVSPFLTRNVETGQWFWLMLYPRTITGLRHVWTHPAFAEKPALPAPEEENCVVVQARERLKQMAAALRMDYDEMMENAAYHASNPDYYWIQGARFEGESLPDDFWGCYQIVTGVTVPEESQGTFFSCNCD